MFLLIIYTFTTFYVIFVFYVFVFFLYYQWVGICIVSFFVHGVGRVGSGHAACRGLNFLLCCDLPLLAN